MVLLQNEDEDQGEGEGEGDYADADAVHRPLHHIGTCGWSKPTLAFAEAEPRRLPIPTSSRVPCRNRDYPNTSVKTQARMGPSCKYLLSL